MRFIALMTPAIQSMVNGSANTPSSMVPPNGLAMWSMRKPTQYMRAATANWTTNLMLGAAPAEVVEDAQEGDDRAAREEATGAPGIGPEPAADLAVHEVERGQRREEGADDGDAAEPRDGLPVDLARAERVIEEPPAARQVSHDGRESRRRRRRREESDSCRPHA